jgi:hypothetical protein
MEMLESRTALRHVRHQLNDIWGEVLAHTNDWLEAVPSVLPRQPAQGTTKDAWALIWS